MQFPSILIQVPKTNMYKTILKNITKDFREIPQTGYFDYASRVTKSARVTGSFKMA